LSKPQEVRPDEVDLEFWLSADNKLSYQLANAFSDFYKKFKKSEVSKVHFRLHYSMWYCNACEVNEWANPMKDCLSGGRYCANDPGTRLSLPTDGIGPLDGRDVLMETLR